MKPANQAVFLLLFYNMLNKELLTTNLLTYFIGYTQIINCFVVSMKKKYLKTYVNGYAQLQNLFSKRLTVITKAFQDV